MATWDEFEKTVITNIVNISSKDNDTQNKAIKAPINQSLYLVAGPGSGKTTFIALRVLKLILVDNIDPSEIMVTTFTKKAAAELLSRILSWWELLSEDLLDVSNGNEYKVNINSIKIGTLDSIIEEVMRDYHDPGTPKPIVIEDFVSKALNIRVLWDQGRYQNTDLKNYLSNLNGKEIKTNEMNDMILKIKDRAYNDLINLEDMKSSSGEQGVTILCDCIGDYKTELKNRLLFDFARLEYEFFEKIKSQEIEFFEDLKFILIDEYQDTNYLQEQIYFKLLEYPLKNGGSISIVGDDDQSLYRFRGATVELFHNFQERIKDKVGIELKPKYLSKNYRSTESIVNFCNDFIELDSDYQNARVKGKPPIEMAREKGSYVNFPILGMFRKDIDELSTDLAKFIDDVINNGGYSFNDDQGNEFIIRINPQGGSASDLALLSSSPNETGFYGDKRLPCLLRNKLKDLSKPIEVFNPRGEGLEKIHKIKILCGLILECIDPGSMIQNAEIKFKTEIEAFNDWRESAKNFINTNPIPHNPTLESFVRSWQSRTPTSQKSWPKEVMLIDLVYKLITWIPYFQDDLEGLIYLEAVLRAISQTVLFSYSESKITFNPEHPEYENNSIKYILKDIFSPIAFRSIDKIEESLIEESLTSNRLNIMSIHQSKGLEFPLVIVDVGSDLKSAHWANSHKRFPQYKNGTKQVINGESVNMEDEFNPYSDNGSLERSNLDRAFDDLIRKYFVAFSRAQDVLLLIGLDNVKEGYYAGNGKFKQLPNIATGWDRRKSWKWGKGLNLENLIHI